MHNLDVLPGRVHNPDLVGDIFPESLHLDIGQRVNQEKAIACSEMHEAQLRKECLLTHEFGIDTENVVRVEICDRHVAFGNQRVFGHQQSKQ